MPRRVSLPAADELFRTTGGSAVQSSAPQQNGSAPAGDPAASEGSEGAAPDAPSGDAGADAAEHAAAGEGDESAASAPPAEEAGGGEHGGREQSARGDDRTRRQSPSVPAQGAQSGKTKPEGAGARTDGASTRNGGAGGSAGGPAKGRQNAGSSGSGSSSGRGRAAAPRRPSGRERHDEKITVYVSAEELMDLEHARLVLRGEHGLAVDRGRIVREAVAVVLADLESRGDASILVRRLRGR